MKKVFFPFPQTIWADIMIEFPILSQVNKKSSFSKH